MVKGWAKSDGGRRKGRERGGGGIERTGGEDRERERSRGIRGRRRESARAGRGGRGGGFFPSRAGEAGSSRNPTPTPMSTEGSLPP